MSDEKTTKDNVFSMVNKVDGFDPWDYLIQIPPPADRPDDPPKMYLEVAYRIFWFRLKYPTGKIFTREVKIDERMAVFETKVYKDAADPDDAFLANGFGQKLFNANDGFGIKYVECAETTSIGRALTKAGFNWANVADETEEPPVDTTVTRATPSAQQPVQVTGQGTASVQPVQAARPAQNPTAANNQQPRGTAPQPPVQAQSPQQQRSQSGATPPRNVQSGNSAAPVDEIMASMTFEDAKNYTIPFGNYKGKTMGQIAIEKPGSLNWYIDSYSGPNNALRASAKILLAAAS